MSGEAIAYSRGVNLAAITPPPLAALLSLTFELVSEPLSRCRQRPQGSRKLGRVLGFGSAHDLSQGHRQAVRFRALVIPPARLAGRDEAVKLGLPDADSPRSDMDSA